MGLLQVMETHLRRNERLTDLAGRVAASSFDSVWQRVQARIFNMAPAEARGYARARARAVIERALEHEARGLSRSSRSRLYALAMEGTIRRVANEVYAAPSHHARRRAA